MNEDCLLQLGNIADVRDLDAIPSHAILDWD